MHTFILSFSHALPHTQSLLLASSFLLICLVCFHTYLHSTNMYNYCKLSHLPTRGHNFREVVDEKGVKTRTNVCALKWPFVFLHTINDLFSYS